MFVEIYGLVDCRHDENGDLHRKTLTRMSQLTGLLSDDVSATVFEPA